MRRVVSLLVALTLAACVARGGEDLPWAATQRLEDITGLRVPKDWDAKAVFLSTKDFKYRVNELPSFYDWRFYAQGLTPVRRQAYNDCWAQGTVGVIESLIKIHFFEERQISVQEIIDCSGRGTAARGGYFAHEYHVRVGAATEADYPYAGRDQRCQRKESAYKLEKWGYIGARGRRPTTEEMKQAIMEFGPIGVTITANSALQRFRGEGVFTGCSSRGTNHIEVIVGWNDGEGDKGVWFVRNSWGETHGDKGYAKIPYGCSRVGETSTWAQIAVTNN